MCKAPWNVLLANCFCPGAGLGLDTAHLDLLIAEGEPLLLSAFLPVVGAAALRRTLQHSKDVDLSFA